MAPRRASSSRRQFTAYGALSALLSRRMSFVDSLAPEIRAPRASSRHARNRETYEERYVLARLHIPHALWEVSGEETRGVRKKGRRKRFHRVSLRRNTWIVGRTCNRGESFACSFSIARRPIKLNESTAGHTLLRGCYTFVTRRRRRRPGMCALTLVQLLLFSSAESSLHGPPAVHRNEDKCALGGADAPMHDRSRDIVRYLGFFDQSGNIVALDSQLPPHLIAVKRGSRVRPVFFFLVEFARRKAKISILLS